jgi:hypothetical protein
MYTDAQEVGFRKHLLAITTTLEVELRDHLQTDMQDNLQEGQNLQFNEHPDT